MIIIIILNIYKNFSNFNKCNLFRYLMNNKKIKFIPPLISKMFNIEIL